MAERFVIKILETKGLDFLARLILKGYFENDTSFTVKIIIIYT